MLTSNLPHLDIFMIGDLPCNSGGQCSDVLADTYRKSPNQTQKIFWDLDKI